MTQDVCFCYTYKVGEVDDMEIRDIYSKLCDNGVLKQENIILERKGLTCALDFLQVFKIEWITIILSRIHDNQIWLKNVPIRITKRTVNRVLRYPTLDRPKSMCSNSKEVIERNRVVTWNKRGISIDTVSDPLVTFAVRVIAHKFF